MVTVVENISNFWVVVFSPRAVLVFLTWTVGNVTMLIAPGAMLTMRQRSFALAGILIPAACAIFFLPDSMRGQFFIGFYIWEASFILMSFACIAYSCLFVE